MLQKTTIAKVMFYSSIIGFIVTFPLWLLGIISDRTMIGITLVLSWAALWYESFTAMQVTDAQEES